MDDDDQRPLSVAELSQMMGMLRRSFNLSHESYKTHVREYGNDNWRVTRDEAMRSAVLAQALVDVDRRLEEKRLAEGRMIKKDPTQPSP